MPRSYHALKGTCLGSAWALGCNGTSGIVLSRIGVLNPVTQRLFKWWVLGQQLTLHNTCSGLQALELTWFHTLKCRQIGPQLRGHIATESSETTLYPLKGSCRGSGYNQFRCMNDGDEQVSYWLCSSHKALITLFTYVTIYSIYIYQIIHSTVMYSIQGIYASDGLLNSPGLSWACWWMLRYLQVSAPSACSFFHWSATPDPSAKVTQCSSLQTTFW